MSAEPTPTPSPNPTPSPAPVRRPVRPVPTPLPEGTRYLSSWGRFMASVIDSVLLLAIITPLIMLLNGANARGLFDPYIEQFTYLQDVSAWFKDPASISAETMPLPPAPPSPVELLIKIGLPACAFLVFWKYRSATPGKMIFRSRIVDATTLGPPSNSQLIIRYLGYYLGVMTCLMGFVTILFDKRRQGIHDKLANTVVITP